jgi:site-specific recombinase XerD
LLVAADTHATNADAFGALDPSALYQSLKRFFVACSERAAEAGVEVEVDVDRLRQASTHWMRHFFANSAVNDQVDLPVLRDAMGHASLATTSIYLRTERDRMVKELGKMRRRG